MWNNFLNNQNQNDGLRQHFNRNNYRKPEENIQPFLGKVEHEIRKCNLKNAVAAAIGGGAAGAGFGGLYGALFGAVSGALGVCITYAITT